MKQLTSALAIAAGLSMAAHAQESRDIDVAEFDSIDAGGGMRLVVVVGETHTVRIVGDADEFDDVEIDVRRGELDIDQDSGWFGRRSGLDVTVEVTVPSLDELDVGRGINAEVTGIASDQLWIDVSTGARLEVSGTCSDLEVDLSTGAVLYADGLVCENVDVDASTGASGRLHASESASARASTGASIRVSGSPSRRDARSSLGGSVRFDRSS